MLAVDDRFWAKVSRGTQDECWPWIPAKPGEYGRFYLEGRVILAHRYALESRLGRKLAARALHHCDNVSQSTISLIIIGKTWRPTS